MAEPLVSDELWAVLEPLLPKHKPSPKDGRPRVEDRKALTGILFVLKSDILWEMLPQEMGCRRRDDLLATIGRVAGSGGLGPGTLRDAQASSSCRSD